jgi:hypothetical protein
MANIDQLPDYKFVQIATPTQGDLTLSKSITTSDTSLIVGFEPKNEDGTSITKDFFIQLTSTSSGKRYTETMLCTAVNGSILTVVRGIARGGLDYVGSATNAISHQAGTVISANLPAPLFQAHDSALKGEIGATIKFNERPSYMSTGLISDRVFADATARDAAITSPVNGDRCYNTATGTFQKYAAGAWADDATGTTSNGSTTVAGKFEEATQAEIDAATATGGTGAQLAVNPATLATSIYGTRLPSANEKIYLTALESSGTTVAEIDQALDGISANVTAANLSTIVGGGATTLHTHASFLGGFTTVPAQNSTGNVDTVVSVPFTATKITLHYRISSIDDGVVNDVYGTANFSGTSMIGAMYSRGLQSSYEWGVTNNAGTALFVGNGAGNDITTQISINSITASDVTVRIAFTKYGTGGTASSNSFYLECFQ